MLFINNFLFKLLEFYCFIKILVSRLGFISKNKIQSRIFNRIKALNRLIKFM